MPIFFFCISSLMKVWNARIYSLNHSAMVKLFFFFQPISGVPGYTIGKNLKKVKIRKKSWTFSPQSRLQNEQFFFLNVEFSHWCQVINNHLYTHQLFHYFSIFSLLWNVDWNHFGAVGTFRFKKLTLTLTL